MAGEAHALEKKLAIVLAAEQGVPVKELCEQLGVHRDTVHEWRRRFRAEGLDGLIERSRRPLRSPGQTSADVEDRIVRLRKELKVDNGADAIGWRLRRQGVLGVPSNRTIHRILVRRGLVDPQPQKRPKSSYRRFEYARPNACWQIDATDWRLTGSRRVTIMDIIDDHSRAVMALRVGPRGATTELALATVFAGAETFGLPAMVLSDNGSCFTTRDDHAASDFESVLAAAGIRTIHSRPYHPETCGKIERFHQSLKRWLNTQPPARSRAQLQGDLDRFADYYNHQRRHAAAGERTPAERHAATTPALPQATPIAIARPSRITINANLVQADGTVTIASRWRTSVGTEHAGHRVTIIRYGDRALIRDNAHVLADLHLDPTRRYLPSGKPRGGARRRPY
jgi:transposase InsO family protein